MNKHLLAALFATPALIVFTKIPMAQIISVLWCYTGWLAYNYAYEKLPEEEKKCSKKKTPTPTKET